MKQQKTIKPTKKPIFLQDDVINDYQKDLFGHRHIADVVSDSVCNSNTPLTIGIFGGWGTGKSSLLELCKKEIEEKGIRTAKIDAWRYSTADNLRRAFLIHVANQIAPELVGHLSNDLFTSIVESNSEKVTVINNENDNKIHNQLKRFFSNTRRVLHTFVKLLLVFLGFSTLTFLVLLLVSIFQKQAYALEQYQEVIGFIKAAKSIVWSEFFQKFIDLIYIPVALSFISKMEINVFPKQVSVQHERVDADELFSQCFSKVVDTALKNKRGEKKRLVVIVDNLDRLNNGKIIEALECLKTFIENDSCIFIIACDETIVRNVIDTANNNSTSESSGEHYLDKFFQQTFRLPEYLFTDLSNFALRIFPESRLCKELVDSGKDIRNIIGILLPADISSPRKVKRLINEFISLFYVVKGKEKEQIGQLEPGILSSKVENLAKFSTIRAEYPDLYEAIINDPSVLQKLNEQIKSGATITNLLDNFPFLDKARFSKKDLPAQESEPRLTINHRSNATSTISFLRRTMPIIIDDIEQYIWLSQDKEARDLPFNIRNNTKLSLQNNDADLLKTLLDSNDEELQNKIIRYALLLLSEKFQSALDTQNGVKVLSSLLDQVKTTLGAEIANTIVMVLPVCNYDEFEMEELMRILRYTTSSAIESQIQQITDFILKKLNDITTTEKTIQCINQNLEILDRYNMTNLYRKWASEKPQPKIENTISDSGFKLEEGSPHYIVFNWLLVSENNYESNTLGFEIFFRTSFISKISDYVTQNSDTNPLSKNNQEQWIHIISILKKFSTSLDHSDVIAFWIESQKILKQDHDWHEVLSMLQLQTRVIDNIPNLMKDVCFASILEVMSRISDLEENELRSQLIECSFQILKSLHQNNPRLKTNNKNRDQVDHLKKIINSPTMAKPFLEFIQKVLNLSDPDEFANYSLAITEALCEFSSITEMSSTIIAFTKENDFLFDNSSRVKIIEKIRELIKSNTPIQSSLALLIVDQFCHLPQYMDLFSKNAPIWVDFIDSSSIEFYRNILEIYQLIILNLIITPNLIMKKIMDITDTLMNKEVSDCTFAFYYQIEEFVTQDQKVLFAANLLSHLNTSFEDPLSILRICSDWLSSFSPELTSKYFVELKKYLPSQYVEIVPIIDSSWSVFSDQQREELLLDLFGPTGLSADVSDIRNVAAINGVFSISEEERIPRIRAIWEQIPPGNPNKNEFLVIAREFLSRKDLIAIRAQAINDIRQHSDAHSIRNGLEIIKNTYRDGLRETKPIVDVFTHLFGGNEEDIRLAADFVVDCLQPLNLSTESKYFIAKAMGCAAIRVDKPDLDSILQEKADQFLRHWSKESWRGSC